MVYFMRMLIADREPTEEDIDDVPMVWVSLFTRYGEASQFFKDLYPCNLFKDFDNRTLLHSYIKLLQETDSVYMDLLLEAKQV